jgi:hypothetical protein
VTANPAHDALEAAIADVERLRRTLRRSSSPQVRSADEQALAKATALAWFNNHRAPVAQRLSQDDLAETDEEYKALLNATSRAAARTTYDANLGRIRTHLIASRGTVLMPPPPAAIAPTTDAPPSFARLVADPAMQSILARRWVECARCLAAPAPLAATVMMGGLLEGLLLAKINSQPNTAPVFRATAAPKDRKTGNALQLSDWTLKNYIDVAHELKWISQSARDIGNVLRDYRNYVHPQKELSHGVALSDSDATLLWEVAKNISRQLF